MSRIRSPYPVAIAIIAAALLLTACSANTNPSKSPTTATPTNTSPSPTLTSPTPTPITPAEAAKRLRTIARASCDTGNRVGVIEVTTGVREVRAVLATKAQAYKEYRGAALVYPDSYELVLETSGFTACEADDVFNRAAHGFDPAPEVTFNARLGTYETSISYDAETTITNSYRVAAGLITATTRVTPEGEFHTTLTYGTVGKADLEIIKKAVEAMHLG